MNKNIFCYKTPAGIIFIAEKNSRITNLYFTKPENINNFLFFESKTLKAAARQLNLYLNKKIKKFNLQFDLQASDYSKNVLKQVQQIPYGKTVSYFQLAENISKPTHSRAVATVNSRNPIPIFIPCHRVIRKNGDIGGYSGGIKIKEYLLDLENEK
jgi:methylated-DNA-[protein]-cysteine S-methyltransferase